MEMKVLNGYQDVNFRGNHLNSLQRDTSFGSDAKVVLRSPSSELRYNDSGPHREMAIDCPANFVGVKKEPPRLPRPLSSAVQSTPSGSPKGSFGSLTLTGRKGHQAVTGSGTTTSTGSKSRNGTIDTAAVKGSQVSVNMGKSTLERDERDRSDRYRRHQEEHARRKEMEERANQQQELLRASLRGSKKMQDLEERKARARALETKEGFDNPNYRRDDEETDGDRAVSTARLQSGLPKRLSSLGDTEMMDAMSVQDILNSLRQAKQYIQDADDQRDLNRVAQFIVSERFQRLLRIHNRLVDAALNVPTPDPSISTHSTDVCQSVIDSISTVGSSNRIARELNALLNDVHIKNLLLAYDQSVQNKLLPRKTTADDDEREYLYERSSQYGDENIKIVRIQKSAEPLGATVKNEGESVIIGRIVKGGAAEKSGLLHEGDEILEINGVDIRGKSINDVCDLMSNLSGVLTFLINPGLEHGPVVRQDLMMNVRALFSYDPEDDPYIPCRELGLSFLKGDILHVINQDDTNWWQAYRDGEDDQNLAGLIPSKSFQEQKETLRLMLLGGSKENKENAEKSGCHCTHRPKRKRKSKHNNNTSDEPDPEEILTYEEVALYYPQPNRKRPIVLIGPPNVGRQELRQRLMQSDFDRFAAAVPHTSRPIRAPEVNGQDYYFVSRAEFEADIADGRLVEYGEYEKHLFGTGMEAIRQVVNSGKICILNFHPQSIRIMRSSDLKPYFIFVAPPNFEKLKQLRKKQGVEVTDSELKGIIEKARQMEEAYGQYFDMIIVNQDLDKAYVDLLAAINGLEIEPQWVPIQWVT